MASCSDDGKIKVWNHKEKYEEYEMVGHGSNGVWDIVRLDYN